MGKASSAMKTTAAFLFAALSAVAGASNCELRFDTAMSADFYKNVRVSQSACCSLCTNDSRCRTAVYSPHGECHLHDATDSAHPFADRGWTLMIKKTQTIVELAVATPDLSTLVTALKAGGLVDTLSGKGPFTVFAPTNEAFAKLPAATLAHLLDPANVKELDAVLTYHVVAGVAAFSKDLTDGEKIKTVEGQDVTASIYKGNRIFINKALVTTADVSASNGVIHIIDTVLSLPPAPNHLFFYWKNAAYNRCGDVDAAPRMPASLFEPENKAALQAYINVTIALFHITDGNPSDPQKTQLKQGTCKENGCGTLLPGCPSNKPNCDYPNPIMAEWAPKKMMQIICDTACNCNYPSCSDVPDDPKTKHWCSLCGPKFNAPIGITLYNPSDTK